MSVDSCASEQTTTTTAAALRTDNQINPTDTGNSESHASMEEDPEFGTHQPLVWRESELSSSSTTTASSNASSTDQEGRIRTMIGSIANLCSATLGAGILALPFAFYQAGIICGIILLTMSAWATSASIGLLVETCDRYRLSTYEKIVEKGLGRRFRSVVEISILVFCCGTAVGYVIAVGDIMERVIPYMTTFQKQVAMSLVWLIAMLPLSCLKRMKSLECASSVGIISIGTLLVAATVHLIYGTPHDDDTDSEYDPISATKPSILALLGPQGGSALSVLKACPIFFYAFSCQVNVAQIFDELPGRPGAEKIRTMNQVTSMGVLVCGLLYASVSMVTLIDFGTAVKPNILSCYDLSAKGQPLLHVAFLGMAMAVVMAFPLNIFPARVSLIQMWDEKKSRISPNPVTEAPSDVEDVRQPLLTEGDRSRGLDYNSDGENESLSPSVATPVESETPEAREEFHFAQHSFVTMLLAGMALGLALVVPNISVVFGLLGGSTSSLLGFVVPGLLGLEADRGKISAWILVVCGSIIGILTTGVTVYSMFRS